MRHLALILTALATPLTALAQADTPDSDPSAATAPDGAAAEAPSSASEAPATPTPAATAPTTAETGTTAPTATAPTTAAPTTTPAPTTPAPTTPAPAPTSPFKLGGYVEAYYSSNLNAPSNGVTAFRGFDNRHNTLSLSNLALDALFDDGQLIGRVTLQVGTTPATYYGAEPAITGAGGVAATDALLWRTAQQAYGGARFDIGGGLAVEAGLFLSPIGPESMGVKDNWLWSHSNQFFGLPFYHAGARATYGLSDGWSMTAAVYNGWNNIVDNNDEKSVSLLVRHDGPRLTGQVLYFGGVERGRDAPEGRAWRNLFDGYLLVTVIDWLAVRGHANAGFEFNEFGTSWWTTGSLSARAALPAGFAVAGRVDAFSEETPDGASSIFWPVSLVGSGALSLEYRPVERVALRLEGRHDRADGDMFYAGTVTDDALNSSEQTTFTLGLTAWF